MATDAIKVLPGQDLGTTLQYTAGPGTSIFKDRIKSSLVGYREVSSSHDGKTVVSVNRSKASHGDAQKSGNLLPQVGDIVLIRITRINRLQANAEILVVGETALIEEFQGIVRIGDIRATEKDKVKIHTSFRPGDIVRAEVISLGDQSSYFLSTAKNELGVLFAWNEVGEMMYPASWNTMRTDAGATEERKVAKPFV